MSSGIRTPPSISILFFGNNYCFVTVGETVTTVGFTGGVTPSFFTSVEVVAFMSVFAFTTFPLLRKPCSYHRPIPLPKPQLLSPLPSCPPAPKPITQPIMRPTTRAIPIAILLALIVIVSIKIIHKK